LHKGSSTAFKDWSCPIDRRKSPSFYYLSGAIQRKTETTDEKPQQMRTDWGNRYLLKDIIAMNPLVGNTIKVFHEAPEWDKAEKLWQLREKNGKNFMSPLTQCLSMKMEIPLIYKVLSGMSGKGTLIVSLSISK